MNVGLEYFANIGTIAAMEAGATPQGAGDVYSPGSCASVVVERPLSPLLLALALGLTGAWSIDVIADADAGGAMHHLDTMAGVAYDDNVSFGSYGRDTRDDASGELRAAYRRYVEVGHDAAWGISAGLGTRQYVEYPRLGQVELEVGSVWRQRFGRGFHAPVVETGATVTWIESRSDIRTGYQVKLQGIGTRRMTDRITARGGVNVTVRRASDSDVFDQDRFGLFASGDYLVRSRHVLYGTLAIATGDVAVSSRSHDPDDSNDNYYGLDVDPDDAFGNDWYAYGAEADIVSATLGYNFGIDRRRSIDASVEVVSASSSDVGDYDRTLVRLQYLHRFRLR